MRGRPTLEYPVPRIRKRKKSWRIWWQRQRKQYEIILGDVTEKRAEIMRDRVALALKDAGEWPVEIAHMPAVRRYLLADFTGHDNYQDSEQIIREYQAHLIGEVSEAWALQSIATIRELLQVSNLDPQHITPREAQEYLDHVLSTPGPHLRRKGIRTTSTRNRCLAICSRFFKWALQTGRVPINPFVGIRQLKVDPPEHIIYCTRIERYRILRAAQKYDDQLALWLAMYAGMRLGEIARARWGDVSFASCRLIIPKSKTRKRRVIPLAKRLMRKLHREHTRKPHTKKHTSIIPWPESEQKWKWKSKNLITALTADLTGEINPECVGWTSFRHTFGSLLAQAGVSIDKISAWMGNTPEVCRRHYAEFIPRDGRDEEIDLL